MSSVPNIRADDFESRVVWLFGSPRSGSTWLAAMASQNPSVLMLNEPTIGYHLSPWLCNEPGYRAEDLNVDTMTIRRVLDRDRSKFFAAGMADAWLPGLRRLINDRLRAHVAGIEHRSVPDDALLLVKEPNGSQSADVIMRAQPTARLLFLLRDGRDVVDSELASFAVGGWQEQLFPHMRGVGEDQRFDFVIRSAYQWLWRTEVVQAAFADHGGAKHMLRYEDLLREPARHLGELLEWLDVPFTMEDVKETTGHYTFERMASRKPGGFNRSATPGAWRENLRPGEQEAIEAILRPKLNELGYE
jgi:Sulfotransferase family